MKMVQTPFWNNFGTVAAKTEILEHRPGAPGGFFMPFYGAAHPRYTRCLGLVFPDDAVVEILLGVHAGMAGRFYA